MRDVTRKVTKMKKRLLFGCILLSFAYAPLFGIGCTCFLNLSSLLFALPLDGQSVMAGYSSFALYCAVVWVLASAAMVGLIIWNVRLLRGKHRAKWVGWCEAALSLVLWFFIMRLWM